MSFDNEVKQFSHPAYNLFSYLISTFKNIFKKAASINEHFYEVLLMNSFFVFTFGITELFYKQDLSIIIPCLIGSLILIALAHAFKNNRLVKAKGYPRVTIVSILTLLTGWSLFSSIFGLIISPLFFIGGIYALVSGEFSVHAFRGPLLAIISFYSVATGIRLIHLFLNKPIQDRHL